MEGFGDPLEVIWRTTKHNSHTPSSAEGRRMTGSAFEIHLGAGRCFLRCSRRDLRLKIGEGPGGDRGRPDGNPGKKGVGGFIKHVFSIGF